MMYVAEVNGELIGPFRSQQEAYMYASGGAQQQQFEGRNANALISSSGNVREIYEPGERRNSDFQHRQQVPGIDY